MCVRSYVFLLAGICARSIGHSGESYRHATKTNGSCGENGDFVFADLFLSGRRVREREGGSGTSGGEMPDILVAVPVSAHRNKSMSVNTAAAPFAATYTHVRDLQVLLFLLHMLCCKSHCPQLL